MTVFVYADQWRPPVDIVIHPQPGFKKIPSFASGNGHFGVRLWAIIRPTTWEHAITLNAFTDCTCFVDREPLDGECIRIIGEQDADALGELFTPTVIRP